MFCFFLIYRILAVIEKYDHYWYGASARALTPYTENLNHCRICTPASEDGLKESPKHVRQK
jgi:hypothetical protein